MNRSYICAVRFLLGAAIAILFFQSGAFAQSGVSEVCPRASSGSVVSDPLDLRSEHGVLRVDLTYRSMPDSNGHLRYCYIYKDSAEAPTLRLHPGDELILNLKNDLLTPPGHAGAPGKSMPMSMNMASCTGNEMTSASTNLHFHGLTVPPTCHQDDVLNTAVDPSDPPFEYHFKIPSDEAPGLYWYHPHVHGFSNEQVLGGASGAMIIEGIQRVNTQLAGLPERVFVVRDQDLVNPAAEPVHSDSVPAPVVLRDSEGDVLNTGTGEGKPAKDLSLNFVPVAFPQYVPAVIKMKPSEKQFWRVLNASAITYLDLQVLVNGSPQQVGVVALDGVPIDDNGLGGHGVIWESHVALPPAGRAEFIMKGLPEGVHASFVTRAVDTGPAGENDPTRPLAIIVASADAPEPSSVLDAAPGVSVPQNFSSLEKAKPVRERTLYFSEEPQDPGDPNSPTKFYITVDGQERKQFDPNSTIPNIVVHQGDVEDWIIENRSQELHAFHIHQIHFMLMEWNDVPVDEPYLRDTVNVAYWDGRSPVYPSVRLRMDFRDPNSIGTFVYHCHLLEHEDGGMMGTIRVDPPAHKP